MLGPFRPIAMRSKYPIAAFAAALLATTASSPAMGVPVELLPGSGSTASPARDQLDAGYAALKRDDFEAAREAFIAASKLAPNAAAPLLGLAEVARRQNQPAAVEKWLKQALAVAPESADTHRAWGRYQFARRDFATAEAAMRKAATLDPTSALAQLDLGDLYMTGVVRPADAERAYRQAIKLNPEHAGAHNGLGAALAASGKTGEAVREFETAARLAPGNPLPLQALGRLYAARGDNPRALEAHARALQAQPGFIPALLDRGDIFLVGYRDPTAAADEYRRAVQLAPKSAPAQFKLGSAYHALDRLDDAERHYRAAIEADGTYALAYNNLAALGAQRKRDLDAALKAAKRAVELGPNVAEFHDTLGSVYLARGELDAAIAEFRRAAAAKPPVAAHYYHLGLALAQRSRKGEAIEALTRALSVNPNFADAREARRKIAELRGQ
jgi:tetratricopeptide (TPR) repeat protein